MDPPTLPPLSSAPAAAALLVYPDSASPRSRTTAADSSDDEPLAQVPGGAKLRLMCSYGGHIIPRPHDKSLCYVGGETRIVVAERHSSLSDLTSRLSKTLLNGRPFTLKYQLPNEDLDSLISVTSDEDFENMVEEYDMVSSTTNISSVKASNLRLRLFLFFSKPETAALLDDAKSESWFVDALNGSGLLPRNLSDSAAGLDCLPTGGSSDSANQADFFGDGGGGESEKNGNAATAAAAAVTSLQEVHSVPESAFVESNTSSSGSSSCLANLPPIWVRVGIEEQCAQMGFPAAQAVTSALPPNPVAHSGETTMNRINSDDEIAAQKFRKPPLPTPLQPQLFNKHGGGGGYSLASPDSVTSDSSIASANSVSKPMYYQEQIQVASREGGRAPVSPNTASDGGASDQGSRSQVQQVQDSGYGLPSMHAQSDQQQQLLQQHQQQQQQLQQQQQQQQQQLQQQQQQQLVHAAQYMTMHHHPAGQVPMSPYYTMYAPPPQQQQLHHQIDPQQQYPVYLMPVAPQSQQAYKMTLQSNMPDPNGVAAPASSCIAAQSPQGAYKDNIPPLYPPKTVSPAMPEMTTQSVYQTSVTPAPQLVQIPSNQYQQQYLGYTTQMHHPSQSIAVPPSATAPNYSYEYANEQAFYTQHQPAPLPPHYQSMTPAAAAVALSEESKQLATAAAYPAADQSHTQQA